MTHTDYLFLAEWLIRIVMALVIISRRRSPTSALGWMVVVAFVPIAGALLYLLVGESRLGVRRSRRHLTVQQRVTLPPGMREVFRQVFQPTLGGRARPIATLAEAEGASAALGGNNLTLLAETDEVIDQLAACIDGARHHCHLLYFIFQVDASGRRIVDTLVGASRRGVACRLLVDAVGSKQFLRDGLCQKLLASGVEVAAALPVNPLRAAVARLDLRNHRKLALIDGRAAFTGSHNISNPIYPRKARYGAWMDTTVRLTGPAVHLLQEVFLQDWSFTTGVTLDERDLFPPIETPGSGSVPVQVLPTGPGSGEAPLLQVMVQALSAASERVVFTTPYFVPGDAILSAMRSAALRGAEVVLVVPRHSDHAFVQAAGRSQYGYLLDAGVQIHEFTAGLLHAKTLTVDHDLSVIGSANLDLRSFLLNFELALLVYSSDFTSQLRFLQTRYIQASERLTAESWRCRGAWRVAGDNLAKLMTPLL